MLARSNPEVAKDLLKMAQDDVDRQWRVYSNRAAMTGSAETPEAARAETQPASAPTSRKGNRRMIDISTRYLGLTLKSPIVASASPLCESVDNLRRMEDAGIAAVVLPSLFEEQLQLESQALDSDLSRGDESFAESLNYFPAPANIQFGARGLPRVDPPR